MLACGSAENSGDSSGTEAVVTVASLSDDALAHAALRLLGANVAGEQRSGASCVQCHDTNKLTLSTWATNYKAALANIRDDSQSVDARINFLRRDPSDTGSGFAPHKLGFLTAGAHLGVSAQVIPADHPTTYAIGKSITKLFAGRDADYAHFRADALMPIDVTYPRLSPQQFETIIAWVDKGMPELDTLLQEAPRPTSCTDDFSQLAGYPASVAGQTWATANKNNLLPMFACDASGNPLNCFTQSQGGNDVFPQAQATSFGTGWATNGATVRVLRVVNYSTFYWMRSSADGRFIADGGGPRDDGAGAVIADLQAALTGGTRDIAASASYDPDFFPGNQGFMFQGGAAGGSFCAQDLLTNPATTKVSFTEANCSKLNSVGLYQTVGQISGDNSISDIFVVNSTFASDNPGLTSSDADLQLTAGPDATVNIHVAVARGNDADSGYQVTQSTQLPTPFQGDTMMSRSGFLIGSRVAGDNTMLGYAISRLVSTKGPGGYAFTLNPLGRICMPGNKANFSFDERFLVTHHYLTQADFASDPQSAQYQAKGASDIYMVDFVKGTKTKITHMNPGQFAIYPHFRSDGWLYFLVRDANTHQEYFVGTDAAVRAAQAH